MHARPASSASAGHRIRLWRGGKILSPRGGIRGGLCWRLYLRTRTSVEEELVVRRLFATLVRCGRL
jgi:hypothetical protein